MTDETNFRVTNDDDGTTWLTPSSLEDWYYEYLGGDLRYEVYAKSPELGRQFDAARRAAQRKIELEILKPGQDESR